MATMSYCHKPRSNPLEYHTLHQILDKHAANNPDKECIVLYDTNQQRTSLTYQQLKDQSIKFAASLLKLGFKRGDRSLLYSRNSLELVVCWMAMSRLGICAALKYATENKWEWLELAKQTQCTAAILGLEGITDDQRQRLVNEVNEVAKQNDFDQNLVIITIGKTNGNINHPNIQRYENLIDVDSNQPDVKQAENKVDPDDAAFVCFTSGTTSGAQDVRQLKAVVYTQHAVINGLKPSNIRSGGTFISKPITWGFGFTSLITTIISGSTYVCTLYKKLLQDRYKVMFDAIQSENLSHAGIAPQCIHQLVAEKFYEKYDVSKIEGWGFGSQLIHRTTIQALLDVLPHSRAALVYAATETLAIAFQPFTQETVKNKEDYGKMQILPDIEVKVIDNQGLVVPLGTKGEICARGPKMFLEYLENPAATMTTKKQTGWVHTGDYGIMYERARLKVLGRKEDLIVTKDLHVFPVEVEEVLVENPDVQDVIVVGVPNNDGKHDICACVIEVPGSKLKGMVSELANWCKTTFSGNKQGLTPKYIVFLELFPISNGGKYNRGAIKGIVQESYRYKV